MWYFQDQTSGAVIAVEAEHDAVSVRRQAQYREVDEVAYLDKLLEHALVLRELEVPEVAADSAVGLVISLTA